MRRLKDLVNYKKLNKKFDLRGESIRHGRNYELLISVMEEIKELQSFELILGANRPSYDENRIKEQGAIIIGEGIAKSQQLKQINIELNNNNIGNQGVLILFEGISKSQNINTIKIDLSSNSIDDVGLKYLGQGIKNLPLLQSLNITLLYNKITKNGFEFLLEELKQCKNLKYLTLNLRQQESQNIIQGKQVGQYLSKCKNLRYFSLLLEKYGKIRELQCDCENFLSQIRICDQITFLDFQIIFRHTKYQQNNKRLKLFKVYKLARLVQFKHKLDLR